MSPEEQSIMIKKHVDALAEHFEAVQIFASHHIIDAEDPHDGETLRIDYGTGNYLARYGQVREWIIGEDEINRSAARKSMDQGADGDE